MNYTYRIPTETGHNLSQGLDNYFQWIVYVQPSFITYFLIMVWVVIFVGGSFTDKKLTNRNEFTKWAFLASILTSGITLLLSFNFPALGLGVLVVNLALTILTAIIYFMTK